MRVLMALPFSPVPADFGGALRVYHLARQIASRHEVTVLTYGEPHDAPRIRSELNVSAVHVLRPTWQASHRRLGQLYSTFTSHSFFQQSVVGPRYQQALDQLLAHERFDIIHTEFSHLGPFALRSPALKVLDAHNVEYDNFRRMWLATSWGLKKLHYGLEYRKQRADELALARSSDLVLTTSERDQALLASQLQSVPCCVVPNGVDLGYFEASSSSLGEVEPKSLVFTGMMAYVPNHDGMGWFLDEVFPRIVEQEPNVKIYVVGKNPPTKLAARASRQVIVTGPVPDVRPYLRRAAVAVVPLRMGGGTRLKIVEALAMRRPVVTTTLGAEGLSLTHEKTALFADDAAGFAMQVVRLIRDELLQRRLAETGHKLVTERYGWNAIGQTLESIYQRYATDLGRCLQLG